MGCGVGDGGFGGVNVGYVGLVGRGVGNDGFDGGIIGGVGGDRWGCFAGGGVWFVIGNWSSLVKMAKRLGD